MAGFGTGFANTFVPSGRLALLKEEQARQASGGGRSGGVPAINMPIGGQQAPVRRDYSHQGGGAPAIPPPAQRAAALQGAEQQTDVWTSMMDKRAERQAGDFDNAISRMFIGDASGMTDYFTRYGNPELKAEVNVTDDGNVTVDFLDKDGKRTGGSQFDSIDDFYLKFAARAKPRDFRGKQVPISEAVTPEYDAVGNEYTGFSAYDKSGIYGNQRIMEGVDLDALAATKGGGGGGGKISSADRNQMYNILGSEYMQDAINNFKANNKGELPNLSLNDPALAEKTWNFILQNHPDQAVSDSLRREMALGEGLLSTGYQPAQVGYTLRGDRGRQQEQAMLQKITSIDGWKKGEEGQVLEFARIIQSGGPQAWALADQIDKNNPRLAKRIEGILSGNDSLSLGASPAISGRGQSGR